MKKTSVPSHGSATRLRLQRESLDLVRKLDSEVSKASSVYQILSGRATSLRNLMRDKCREVIVEEEGDFVRKAEELVWKKAYHDVMQFYKRVKKESTSDEVLLLQTHFLSGVGFYFSLLNTCCQKYNIRLPLLSPARTKNSLVVETLSESSGSSFIKPTVQRTLIYLGDLYRYLEDLGYFGGKSAASNWYSVAHQWDPKLGMPYNQLGTLSGGINYGLTAAYYYMRCATSIVPFEGAEMNMKRIFNGHVKDRKRESTSPDSVQQVKECILHFLSIVEIFWTGSGRIVEVDKFNSLFKIALDLPAKLSTEDAPTFLNEQIVFNMSVMTLMLFERLKQKNCSASLSSVNTALALNFFTTVVSSCRKKFKELLGNNFFNGNVISSLHQLREKSSSPDFSPRQLPRRRRKKIAMNYDDVDMEFTDFDQDPELAEIEETVLSTLDQLAINSDMSDSGEDSEEDTSSEGELGRELSGKKEVPQNGKPKSLEEVLRYTYSETSLPSIKIFCDWLTINSKLLEPSVDTCSDLFTEFVLFLNALQPLRRQIFCASEKYHYLKCEDKDWQQKFPLSCDWAVYQFSQLTDFHHGRIDFSQASLSDLEMGIVCVESVYSFGIFLSHRIPLFCYDAMTDLFEVNAELSCNGQIGKDILENFINTDDYCSGHEASPFSGEPSSRSSSKNSFSPESKRKEEAKRLAVQFLKSEVNQLERRVNGVERRKMPPFLVLDSSAFCEHLALIKELATSQDFILVIPKIVLASLDQVKKISAPAREAMRWLEKEANRGSRALKFQKETERLGLGLLKYPPRKEKDAYDFYLLLESCCFLNHQNSSTQDDWEMATLLTGNANRFPPNGSTVARTAGVQLEEIGLFVSKWRNSSKAKA